MKLDFVVKFDCSKTDNTVS